MRAANPCVRLKIAISHQTLELFHAAIDWQFMALGEFSCYAVEKFSGGIRYAANSMIHLITQNVIIHCIFRPQRYSQLKKIKLRVRVCAQFEFIFNKSIKFHDCGNLDQYFIQNDFLDNSCRSAAFINSYHRNRILQLYSSFVAGLPKETDRCIQQLSAINTHLRYKTFVIKSKVRHCGTQLITVISRTYFTILKKCCQFQRRIRWRYTRFPKPGPKPFPLYLLYFILFMGQFFVISVFQRYIDFQVAIW